MKSRRDEVSPEYWNKIWGDVDNFLSDWDKDLELSRKFFVEFDFDGYITSLTKEEILNPPNEWSKKKELKVANKPDWSRIAQDMIHSWDG